MKTITLTVTLELEDETKTAEYLAREVYAALSSSYVFDVEEKCQVAPAVYVNQE